MIGCCILVNPTFAVRQGGARASSTPQNGEPALACTALVSRYHEAHSVLFRKRKPFPRMNAPMSMATTPVTTSPVPSLTL